MEINAGHVEKFKRAYSQEDFDRFAGLTRDTNPIHIDPDFSANTRFGRTVAHGMMLYSTICRVLGTLFPGPGTLPIKQEMMFPNPTFTGTEITVRLEAVAVHSEKKTAEIKTEIQLPDGNYACDGKTMVLLPGNKDGLPEIDPSIQTVGTTESEALKHLEMGQTAVVKRTFTTVDLAEYADLTGDENPLFTDENFARKAGFDRCIIPGPLLSGMFSDLLGTRLPGRGTNWLKQKLHFSGPAYVGEEIKATVEIVRLRPSKDLVTLLDTCTSSSGKLVCQAQSLVRVSDLVNERSTP